MRLHRFYIPETIGPKNEILISSKDLINQIQKVFRLKTGDRLVIFDGTGSDYECRIEKLSKNELVLAVDVTMRSRFNPEKKAYLFASLVKKANFEWIVEKATELGATDIIPVISERSEKKGLNFSRLEKIAIEASEQSSRGKVPKIHSIMDLEEAVLSFLPTLEESIRPFSFHTEGEHMNKKDYGENEAVAVFIGPEGGWTGNEIEMFHRNGIIVRSLGPQILRAETAVIVALAKVI